MNINFGVNKTIVEVVTEGAFGRTYFRDIYSGVNGTKNHGNSLMS